MNLANSSSSSTGVGAGFSGSVSLKEDWSAGFIILSFIVSCVGAATSLQMMKLRKSGFGWRNHVFLIFGAIALGGVGIWCMHFIGMFALTLERSDTGASIDIGWDPGLTVASFIVAVGIVAVGFYLSGDDVLEGAWLRTRIACTGIIGGAGVSTMHYLGMLAMNVPSSSVTWNGGIIFGSVVIGIAVVTLALSIFFHPFFRAYWQRSNLLLLATSVIMGLGVIAMHYTGMQAASWSFDPSVPYVEPSNYLTPTALLALVLPLALCSCLVLVTIQLLLYRQRRSLLADLLHSDGITLVAIVMDSSGKRLLCEGSVLTPPSLKIAESYYNHERISFDRLNVDFLRMLKASFAWPSAHRYLQQLHQLKDKKKITPQAIDLYSKFLAGCEVLAQRLSLPLSALGVLYWCPLNNLLALIVDEKQSRPVTSSLPFLQLSSFQFVDLPRVNSAFAKRLTNGLSMDSFLESLSEYSQRVNASCFSDQSEEQLNELLRNVAIELLNGNDSHAVAPPTSVPLNMFPFAWPAVGHPGKAAKTRRLSLLGGNRYGNRSYRAAAETRTRIANNYVTQEQYVKAWRGALGGFVRTLHNLETLIKYKHNWMAVCIDPMVKSAIEENLLESAENDETTNSQHQSQQADKPHRSESRSDHQSSQPAGAARPSAIHGSAGVGGAASSSGSSTGYSDDSSVNSPRAGGGKVQLYLGLYLAQAVSNSAVHILVPSDYYSFLPVVNALKCSDYSALLTWLDAVEKFSQQPSNNHRTINFVNDAAALLRTMEYYQRERDREREHASESTDVPQQLIQLQQVQLAGSRDRDSVAPLPTSAGRPSFRAPLMDKQVLSSDTATNSPLASASASHIHPFGNDVFRQPTAVNQIRQFLSACAQLGRLLGTTRDLTVNNLSAANIIQNSRLAQGSSPWTRAFLQRNSALARERSGLGASPSLKSRSGVGQTQNHPQGQTSAGTAAQDGYGPAPAGAFAEDKLMMMEEFFEEKGSDSNNNSQRQNRIIPIAGNVDALPLLISNPTTPTHIASPTGMIGGFTSAALGNAMSNSNLNANVNGNSTNTTAAAHMLGFTYGSTHGSTHTTSSTAASNAGTTPVTHIAGGLTVSVWAGSTPNSGPSSPTRESASTSLGTLAMTAFVPKRSSAGRMSSSRPSSPQGAYGTNTV